MEWFFAIIAAWASVLASDELRWLGLVAELDDVRAEAYATSDPALLQSVYAPGSAAGDVDAAMINAYARRGAHVSGAGLVVLSCAVVDASEDRVTLEIVDRLGPARVVWADGTSRALPRDLPTRRVVSLLHTTDGWRIN